MFKNAVYSGLLLLPVAVFAAGGSLDVLPVGVTGLALVSTHVARQWQLSGSAISCPDIDHTPFSSAVPGFISDPEAPSVPEIEEQPGYFIVKAMERMRWLKAWLREWRNSVTKTSNPADDTAFDFLEDELETSDMDSLPDVSRLDIISLKSFGNPEHPSAIGSLTARLLAVRTWILIHLFPDNSSVQIFEHENNAAPSIPPSSEDQDDEETLLQPSTCLGSIPYKQISLGKLIGHGSFGNVYRTIIKTTDAAGKSISYLAATKRPRDTDTDKEADQAQRERLLEEFKQEAELLEALKHPHIVLLAGISIDDELRVLIIMELLPFPLAEKVREKPQKEYGELLTFLQRLRVLMEAIEVLIFFNSKGYFYRDLKVNNLMLDKNLSVKFIDLGMVTDLSMSNPWKEGADYMAPEVVTTGFSEMTEVFSFGFLGFVVLSGKVNTVGIVPVDDSKVNIQEYHFDSYPQLKEEGSHCVDAAGLLRGLIFQCLLKVPEHRPALERVQSDLIMVKKYLELFGP